MYALFNFIIKTIITRTIQRLQSSFILVLSKQQFKYNTRKMQRIFQQKPILNTFHRIPRIRIRNLSEKVVPSSADVVIIGK